jgi:heme ABC exporter ATP-binding subunit CcmA
MISVRGLTKLFGPTRALQGVDLTVSEGESVLIEGPNGSGKTTLLRAIAGLVRPTSGTIEVDGRSPIKSRGAIGYLAHESHLYPHLSVVENLMFFADLYDAPKWAAQVWLENLGLAHKRDARVADLSRGEHQKASLARVLLPDPPIVLADEPFAGLDQKSTDALPTFLRRDGRTLIVATHDLDNAWQVAERIATIDNGRMIDWR